MEIVHGPIRLMGVYLAGVVSGSLLTSITDSNTYLAGASGGCYALLLAHLPTIILNCREMKTFVEWIVRYSMTFTKMSLKFNTLFWSPHNLIYFVFILILKLII